MIIISSSANAEKFDHVLGQLLVQLVILVHVAVHHTLPHGHILH